MTTDGLSPDEHRAIAQEMYDRWSAGEPKSRLEIEYWDNATSHGKAFSTYIDRWLGVSTERKSVQTLHIEWLESLLRAHGLSPDPSGELSEEFRLLAKAREAALAALRIYNDPTSGFRTESFIVLMIVAWNSLLQAMLERDDLDYFERSEDGEVVKIDGRPKVLDTWQLVILALPGKSGKAIRANLDFFLRLRHQIAHRYLPALDRAIVAEAQSLLLNFETLITEQFGEAAALGDELSVPLQLSRFKEPSRAEALKRAQAQLPVDVMDFLTRHRAEVPDDVLRSPEYALRLFFVPITANRERSADAVVDFLRPGDVTPDLEATLREVAVVTKPKRIPVASDDLFRPTEVVEQVRVALPFRFTTDTHTRSWKYYKVRPETDAAERDATDPRYCRYDRLSNGYGYTQAWIDKLVDDLSDPDVYERVVGLRPS